MQTDLWKHPCKKFLLIYHTCFEPTWKVYLLLPLALTNVAQVSPHVSEPPSWRWISRVKVLEPLIKFIWRSLEHPGSGWTGWHDEVQIFLVVTVIKKNDDCGWYLESLRDIWLRWMHWMCTDFVVVQFCNSCTGYTARTVVKHHHTNLCR